MEHVNSVQTKQDQCMMVLNVVETLIVKNIHLMEDASMNHAHLTPLEKEMNVKDVHHTHIHFLVVINVVMILVENTNT